MKESLILWRNKLLRKSYLFFLKPVFFKKDPEEVHEFFIKFGIFLGNHYLTRRLTNSMFNYQNPKLNQTIFGIEFKNPVGLSAGFDKDAQITDIIPNVGFGFEEIGSITGEFCEGNPKPRLWRLKKSNSLVVYYGLKNIGSEAIANNLKNKKFKIPIFTSIAKTNSKLTINTSEGIKDYLKGYNEFSNIGDVFVINISCPNTFGGEPFHDSKKLDLLLKELKKIKTNKPIFIKISPDLTTKQIDDIIEIARKYKISGFTCANLSKKRENIKIFETKLPKDGGISGKPLEELSNNLISYIYKKTRGEFIIIGVGGVDSGLSAYKKIRAGASLVQLITGMIYNGPQLISEINQELINLLNRDGFENISQAIGIDS